jgi:hypothetical protein
VVEPVLVTVDPPRTAKLAADPRTTGSAWALTANSEKTKTKANMEDVRNFILPPYPQPEPHDPGFDHRHPADGEIVPVRLI